MWIKGRLILRISWERWCWMTLSLSLHLPTGRGRWSPFTESRSVGGLFLLREVLRPHSQEAISQLGFVSNTGVCPPDCIKHLWTVAVKQSCSVYRAEQTKAGERAQQSSCSVMREGLSSEKSNRSGQRRQMVHERREGSHPRV